MVIYTGVWYIFEYFIFIPDVFLQYFTEDTGPLWKAHCQRDFKETSTMKHDDWRALYLVSFMAMSVSHSTAKLYASFRLTFCEFSV